MAATQPITHKKNSMFREAALKVFPVLQQKRAQSSMIVGLTLFALIVLGLFAINPTVATIIQLNKQIEDDTLVYNKLQEKISNLTTLQKKYEDLQPDLPIVLAAIPSSYELPKLLGQIQTLAAKNHLELTSLQSNPISITTISPSTLSTVSFVVTVTGTQDNVLTFISSFNSFERITTIQKISIGLDAGEADIVEATIQGTASFLPL